VQATFPIRDFWRTLGKGGKFRFTVEEAFVKERKLRSGRKESVGGCCSKSLVGKKKGGLPSASERVDAPKIECLANGPWEGWCGRGLDSNDRLSERMVIGKQVYAEGREMFG